MFLENQKCRIEIKVDETYTVDSADNRPYDVVYNPCYYKHRDLCKTFSIHIDLFSSELHIALIGPFYSYVFDCGILDDEILTVLQDNTITQIRVTDGSLVRHIQFDCIGCNFGIYKIRKGYIIYGEMEIVMLDFDFIKMWSFSGKDIFVSVSGKTSFELKESSICLYDFEGNDYELDFDGNLIQ